MKLNNYIDHTLLKADAKLDDIIQLCKEAKDNNFYSVCVNSSYVPLAAYCLQDSSVKVCTVCGFPLGAMETTSKAYEADMACENGASEIDMVMNIGRFKSGDFEFVVEDIATVAEFVHQRKAILKVIIETSLLNEDEIVKACQLALEGNCDFVKTSTGFSTGGAKVTDVALMKKTVGNQAKVKASGGIRDKETAIKMIEAGAERLGVSASLKIIEE